MTHRSLARRLAGTTVATLLLAAISAPAIAQNNMAQDKAFK